MEQRCNETYKIEPAELKQARWEVPVGIPDVPVFCFGEPILGIPGQTFSDISLAPLAAKNAPSEAGRLEAKGYEFNFCFLSTWNHASRSADRRVFPDMLS